MGGLFNHYLPATFELHWPVYENYRLQTLTTTIADLEENRGAMLTDSDRNRLSEILDPDESFPLSYVLQRVLMIVPASETIRKTVNPFSGFVSPEEPLIDLQRLAGEKIGWDSENIILRCVHRASGVCQIPGRRIHRGCPAGKSDRQHRRRSGPCPYTTTCRAEKSTHARRLPDGRNDGEESRIEGPAWRI